MKRATGTALLIAGAILIATGVVIDKWHYVGASNSYITVAGFASRCHLWDDHVGLDPRPDIVDCSRAENLTSLAAGLIALGAVALAITAVIGLRNWRTARGKIAVTP